MAYNESATTSRITVVPLAPALGARVQGVDAGPELTDPDFQRVRDALHRYSVVVLPRQRLAPAAQAAFTARLGPLRGKSVLNKYAHPECADVTLISNIVENGQAIGISDAGLIWHTDSSYAAVPDMYSMLYGLEIPMRDGVSLGNTLYASTAAAYDALSDDVKRRIANLRGVHSYAYHIEKKRREGTLTRAPLTPSELAEWPDVEHPVVRTHPYTGRKSLYVSEGHTSHIAGLPADESAALLAQLFAQIKRPEFIYTHRWEPGDLVVWDNCAAQHLAVKDYGTIPRRMHQSGVAGQVPV